MSECPEFVKEIFDKIVLGEPSGKPAFHVHMKSENCHIFGLYVADDFVDWFRENAPEDENHLIKWNLSQDGMLTFRIYNNDLAMMVKLTWLGT